MKRTFMFFAAAIMMGAAVVSCDKSSSTNNNGGDEGEGEVPTESIAMPSLKTIFLLLKG